MHKTNVNFILLLCISFLTICLIYVLLLNYLINFDTLKQMSRIAYQVSDMGPIQIK